MGRRLKKAVVVFAALFGAAQLVRPERANPTTDTTRTIQAHAGTSSELVAILDRACNNCHSNATAWPSYTKLAPLSWLVAYGERAGRKAVNFSDWAAYQPAQQRGLLMASCQDATTGKMPGIYTLVRSDARLSPNDIQTICAAAR